MEQDGETPSQASGGMGPEEVTGTEGATWRQRPDGIGLWAAAVGGQSWRPGAPTSDTTALVLELAGSLRRVSLLPSLLREELPELASRILWLLTSGDGAACMVT
eukprot:14367669-Alexandrium_andersonii.AAC.1